MYVLTCGAHFGRAVYYSFDTKKAIEDKDEKRTGGSNSQLIAMVGTLFLWTLLAFIQWRPCS